MKIKYFCIGLFVGAFVYAGIKAPIPLRKIVVGLYGCNPGGDLPVLAVADRPGVFRLPKEITVCALHVQDDWQWTEVRVGNTKTEDQPVSGKDK